MAEGQDDNAASEPAGSSSGGAEYDARLAQLVNSQRQIYAYIVSLMGSRRDADEVLQETNVVLLQKLPEFQGRSTLLTWACSIAFHQVLAHRSRRGRSRHVFLDEGLLAELAEMSVERAHQFDARLEALRSCMEKLPEAGRRLLEARYGMNGPIGDLAGHLSQSESRVRVRLHRLRKALAECVNHTLATEGRA